MSSENIHKTVVFLGGNGYIGSHVIEAVADRIKNQLPNDNIKIISISHGVSTIDKWRNAERIGHLLDHTIIWNRDKAALADCQEAMAYPFQNVIMVFDFSSFRADQMRDGLKFARDKLGSPFYLYISTDSLYEVSVKPQPNADGSWPLNDESAARRPESREEIERMKQWDEYAHNKFDAEEVLWAEHGDINFYAPRFCDILGPRDNWEDQWWRYQAWMQIATRMDILKPVRLPAWMATKPISCSFVLDVARMIGNIFVAVATCKGDTAKLPFANDVFNFGGPRPITIPELIQVTTECLGANSENMLERLIAFEPDNTPVPVDFDLYIKANEHYRFGLQRILYPVVSMATAFKVDKFRRTFPDFEFTPFKAIIEKTVEFFEQVSRSEEQRGNFTALLKALRDDLRQQKLLDDDEKFNQACKSIWGIEIS